MPSATCWALIFAADRDVPYFSRGSNSPFIADEEGVDGLGGGAAEHRGEVGALLNQGAGLLGHLVQGEAGVPELGADDGRELAVLRLCETDR